MQLYDVVDEADLRRMLDEGFVREQTHPSLPLGILNYAEKTQYAREWNPVTLACRGLIYDQRDGTVLARPWGKFFNYGEVDLDLDPDAAVEVTDKQDGSLGILYFADGAPAIATRGSFASDQARHATDLYLRRYHCNWTPDPDLTYLFEIIYPANRIVLDYGQMDDLVLLGAVHIEDGQPFGPTHLPEWPGRRTAVMPATTLREALALEPRTNAEGVVVRLIADGSLVKVKQADYVALHKLVTGLNERAVWERLGAGETVASICDALPDEFHVWVQDVATELAMQQAEVMEQARADHTTIAEALGEGFARKDYARLAARSPHRALLFLLLDGKQIGPTVWKSLRPSADNRLCPIATEEAA